MTLRTRFAPSPTGLLHLGHAYSALLAFDNAKTLDAEFLLRIEDTDAGRCRPEFEDAIYQDLAWLGLCWPTPVMRQSERLGAYGIALNSLISRSYCYPCSCSRRDIREAQSAPQEGANSTALPVYPGTCRHRKMEDRSENDAIRLNIDRVLSDLPSLSHARFTETGPASFGAHQLTENMLHNEIGDIVLSRGDTGVAAYHLSVVVDDGAQGITHIYRGEDLFASTFIHVMLQSLLGLPTPKYHHHALIRDDDGIRLAKRDDARALQLYRAQGMTPDDIRAKVGL